MYRPSRPHTTHLTPTLQRRLLPVLAALSTALIGTLSAALSLPAHAANEADLAKQLANPVAALISVPVQFNFDREIGPAREGTRMIANIQPVVPFSFNENWNIISRTILPVVHQSDIFPGAGSQTGLGDVLQSLFFSPKAPGPGGVIWGVGPVFLLPTGTNSLLTADRWASGPTAVPLRALNSSNARCEADPGPVEPAVSLPGSRRASATSSAALRTGTSLPTTTMCCSAAHRAMGAKSLIGS